MRDICRDLSGATFRKRHADQKQYFGSLLAADGGKKIALAAVLTAASACRCRAWPAPFREHRPGRTPPHSFSELIPQGFPRERSSRVSGASPAAGAVNSVVCKSAKKEAAHAKWHRSAPSGTEPHQVTPSGTKWHRAAPSRTKAAAAPTSGQRAAQSGRRILARSSVRSLRQACIFVGPAPHRATVVRGWVHDVRCMDMQGWLLSSHPITITHAIQRHARSNLIATHQRTNHRCSRRSISRQGIAAEVGVFSARDGIEGGVPQGRIELVALKLQAGRIPWEVLRTWPAQRPLTERIRKPLVGNNFRRRQSRRRASGQGGPLPASNTRCR